MRKFAVIFIFCLIVKTSFSQNYVPMPMQNCYWTVDHKAQCFWLTGYGSSHETYTIYPTTDTMINSTRYIKFYLIDKDTLVNGGCSNDTRTADYWGGVRQDTANQKVFVKFPGNGNEMLYYNFNYNVGDTMKGVAFGYGGAYGACRIIGNISYQNFNDGLCRRVYTFKHPCYFSFNNYSYNFYDKLIEGYGMNSGFDNPTLNSSYTSNVQETYLSALYINSQKILQVTNTNTCVQYIGINENELKNDLKISPNPVQDVITVTGNENDLTYIIYDILGKEIMRANKPKIVITDLSPGTYFLKCIDANSKEIIIKKFVKYQ